MTYPNMPLVFTLAACLAANARAAATNQSEAEIKGRVQALLKLMTLEEKVGQ